MSDFIVALVLGVVEGITEFLPISSTGHLILVNQWIGFHNPAFEKLFDVVIQLGAILAVVVIFWDRLWPFGKGKLPERKREIWNLWGKVIVGVLPAVVLGFLFDDLIEAKFFNPTVVACALIAWGIVIILVERLRKPAAGKIAQADGIGYGTAFAIGCIQCLAMIPGTSRSAATIIGAMLLGCTRIAASEFSFFLAIPTMVGASGLKLVKGGASMTGHEMAVLALGFVVAFAVAFVVVRAFMKFIASHKFTGFGVYRIALGALVLVALVLL
jgi:undecaprenyl-diphosphatase